MNTYADCTESQLIDHLRALEHANLGYFDVEEFGAYPPMFVAAWSTPEEVGWPIFADLKSVDAGDGEIIRRAVLGLWTFLFSTRDLARAEVGPSAAVQRPIPGGRPAPAGTCRYAGDPIMSDPAADD